jgi:hypothetical protein
MFVPRKTRFGKKTLATILGVKNRLGKKEREKHALKLSKDVVMFINSMYKLIVSCYVIHHLFSRLIECFLIQNDSNVSA